jgi:hypothetical protein
MQACVQATVSEMNWMAMLNGALTQYANSGVA